MSDNFLMYTNETIDYIQKQSCAINVGYKILVAVVLVIYPDHNIPFQM